MKTKLFFVCLLVATATAQESRIRYLKPRAERTGIPASGGGFSMVVPELNSLEHHRRGLILRWFAHKYDYFKIEIQRKTNGVPDRVIVLDHDEVQRAFTKTNAVLYRTVWIDKDILLNQTYTYRLRYFDRNHTGPWSNELTIEALEFKD